MKNLLIAFLCSALFLTACNPTPQPAPPNSLKMMKNGVPWEADFFWYTSYQPAQNRIKFSPAKITSKLPFDTVLSGRENLHISIKREMGRQYISRPYFLFAYSESEDQGCTTYSLYQPDSANNWVEIVKQEDDYRRIWVKFQATVHDPYPGCGIQDTLLHLTNGEAYMEVVER